MPSPVENYTYADIGRGPYQNYDLSAIDGITTSIVDVTGKRGFPSANPLVAGTTMRDYVRGQAPAVARGGFGMARNGVQFLGGITGIDLPGLRNFTYNFGFGFWTQATGASTNGFNNKMALVRAGNTDVMAMTITANAQGIASLIEINIGGINVASPLVAPSLFYALFDSLNVHQHYYLLETTVDGTQSRVSVFLNRVRIYTGDWKPRAVLPALGPTDPAVVGDANPYIGTFFGRLYRFRSENFSGATTRNPATGQVYTADDIVALDYDTHQARLRANLG